MADLNRRQLLASGVIAAGTVTLINQIAGQVAASEPTAQPASRLNKGDVILFQGDSITDCHRNKGRQKQANDGRALGDGYPFSIAGDVLLANPNLGLKFHNTGISGNRVPSLQARWQKDCLDFKPNILSILVGVNDIWHKMDGKYDGTVEIYRTGFTELLEETKSALPETKLVICEPFALRVGAVKDDWYPEFDERRAVAKEVCDAAGATWVPFQKMFDDAVAAGTQPKYWLGDGVHPSVAGHSLMAATWRKVVGI
jgi:lysophospholipase L1-like esterase